MLAQELHDGGSERPGQPLLEPGSPEQARVSRVAHVAGLDEDLRHGGQVQPGQVITEDHAVVAVVVALGHAGELQQRGAHVAAEPHGRL